MTEGLSQLLQFHHLLRQPLLVLALDGSVLEHVGAKGTQFPPHIEEPDDIARMARSTQATPASWVIDGERWRVFGSRWTSPDVEVCVVVRLVPREQAAFATLNRRLTELERQHTEVRSALDRAIRAESEAVGLALRLESVFESAHESIIMSDPQGNIMLWNAASETMFGYSADEVTGRKIADVIVPDRHRQAHIRGLARFSETGRGRMLDTPMEIDAVRADGSEFPVELVISAVKQEGEWHAIGCLRDISERRMLEEIHLASEERLRSIVDNLADGVLVVDQDAKVVFGNPEAAKALGRDPQDLVAMTFDLPTPAPGEAAELIEFYRPDGTNSSVEIRAVETEWSGQPARLVSIHDLTEVRRLEMLQRQDAEQLKRTLNETIRAVSRTIEIRDPYTAGHQQRVSDLAGAIAAEMGLSDEQTEGLLLGSLIHDIGKIALPAEILTRPGRLTDLEFELIRSHSQAGFDIIADVNFPWPIAQMVLQHHERLDGSGYPNGLRQDEIIQEARIIAVADVVEAMSSHRPYRPALGIESALEEITRNRGKQFDPDVVDACVDLFESGRFSFGPH